MDAIAWTLLSKICLWDDFRSSDPKKSGWCNFATSEVFARPKFWKVFCLIHDCLCTGDCKKYSIHFLHRKSHISQGECDSISQIATKTKQMLPFLTINCPTSPNEKYHAWNREQLSIYDPCTERSLWRVESGSSSWKSLRYGSKPMPVLAAFGSRYHPHINPRTKGPAFLYLVIKPFLGSSFCHWKNTSKLLWLSILFSSFSSSLVPSPKYHRFVCTSSLVFKGLWAWCQND